MSRELSNISVVLEYLTGSGKEGEIIYLDFNEKFPKARGIYFVVNKKGDILYLGIARNLRTRWSSHHQYKNCLNLEAVGVYFWVKNSSENINTFENLLLAEFFSSLVTALNVAGVEKPLVRRKKKSNYTTIKTYAHSPVVIEKELELEPEGKEFQINKELDLSEIFISRIFLGLKNRSKMEPIAANRLQYVFNS